MAWRWSLLQRGPPGVFTFLVAVMLAGSGCNGNLFPALGGSGPDPVYQATVQAYHRLPAQPSYRYAFLPLKTQAGDLEYESYKDLARNELSRWGWAEANERDPANVLVALDYMLDEGKPYEVQIPIIGQTGVSSTRTTGHVNQFGGFSSTTSYTPQFGVVGSRTRSYAQYQRRLYVMIFDSHEQLDGKPKTLFQGTGVSEGTTPHLAPVMPFLMNRVFAALSDQSGAITYWRSDQVPLSAQK